jgi:hypothetical protein
VTTPRRREKRLDHLNAATVPVEGALLERAARLSERGTAMPPGPEADVLLTVSAEFAELAETLHWYG